MVPHHKFCIRVPRRRALSGESFVVPVAGSAAGEQVWIDWIREVFGYNFSRHANWIRRVGRDLASIKRIGRHSRLHSWN